MYIQAAKLINLPVAAIDAQAKIGEIRDIFVDPENSRLLGFLVQTGGLLSPKKVLSIIDVADWDQKAVVTNSFENLVEINDIVRIKDLARKNLYLLDMRAITESGQSLGTVDDFLINSETQSVVKFYLKDILGKTRILPVDKVSRIEREVIFLDDVNEPPKNIVEAEVA